jgi:hypothetical protein
MKIYIKVVNVKYFNLFPFGLTYILTYTKGEIVALFTKYCKKLLVKDIS